MKRIRYNFITLLLTVMVMTSPPTLQAENQENQESQASPLFKFQHKLALKGNSRAQYKLACMYETGQGINQDIQQAKYWYQSAFKEGMKAAGDRLTYLDIMEKGYNAANHTSWLQGVKKDAAANNGDAMYLLAQLLRQGLGVQKDLTRANNILEQVSLLGDADVEDELKLIQAELDNQDKKARQAQVKLARLQLEKEQRAAAQLSKRENSTQAVKTLKAAPQPEKPSLLAQQEAAKKLANEDKVRRYKKAMMQLKKEQRLIDEQQAWASGGATTSADDEF